MIKLESAAPCILVVGVLFLKSLQREEELALVDRGKRWLDAAIAEDHAMTVEELIAVLQKYPSDLRVVVNGYEEGYDDLAPEQITQTRIVLNTGKHDWQGVHGHPDDAKGQITVEAVVLQRTSH